MRFGEILADLALVAWLFAFGKSRILFAVAGKEAVLVCNLYRLANQAGLNERYVSRILECAFLAPDIVEAILAGRQPSGLTVRKLWNKLPMDWVEQRKHLGFAMPSQRANSSR